jgi:hypothetical protein
VDRKGSWVTYDLDKGLEMVTRCILGEFRQVGEFGERGGGQGLFGSWVRRALGGQYQQGEKAAMHQA